MNDEAIETATSAAMKNEAIGTGNAAAESQPAKGDIHTEGVKPNGAAMSCWDTLAHIGQIGMYHDFY